MRLIGYTMAPEASRRANIDLNEFTSIRDPLYFKVNALVPIWRFYDRRCLHLGRHEDKDIY